MRSPLVDAIVIPIAQHVLIGIHPRHGLFSQVISSRLTLAGLPGGTIGQAMAMTKSRLPGATPRAALSAPVPNAVTSPASTHPARNSVPLPLACSQEPPR